MDTRPVVVGVDGGPDSLRALKWAAEYATALDAPLIALTAYQLPAVYGPYAMAGWEDSSELESSAREMLADAVRNALGADASYKPAVLQGHAAEALIAASGDARLVVVGSRGRGGFTGMLLDSVSQHVVAHSHCPVVVLPHSSHETN
ncbi:Nucleotide-binding universal stress protein, UspA family [Dietzia kunjamensis subsp. schimae]|uniref:Nucleotide-binding universal stress protein, UspA family n=1 Tax=Dietzia kunjamensis subsp. schimae TaxID=498198 RepID=A0ABY1MWI1_9ACTN|nr:universal stress protein [Dietzia kunjamensis]MBB1015316.1 universal stress protein [Dietzia kunjamensis subsp. schimae]SMO32333.1 Nucleotide-binding universal stress protein, UspA family [Dietzia kunjamensis subsp. schimae]